MSATVQTIEKLISQEYKQGFVTDLEADTIAVRAVLESVSMADMAKPVSKHREEFFVPLSSLFPIKNTFNAE